MKEIICIVCPRGCRLKIDENAGYSVTGNACNRGEEYGKKELKSPSRVLTTTVRCTGGEHPRCAVKTDGAIPKDKTFEIMDALKEVELTAPVYIHDMVKENICGTGVNVIATQEMKII